MGWMDERIGQALGNDRYRGMAFGWIFLVGIGILNLGRGSIQVFRSDGGAAIIAGWWRPLPVEAPGKFGAVILIPLVALALFSAMRRPRSRPDSRQSPGSEQTPSPVE